MYWESDIILSTIKSLNNNLVLGVNERKQEFVLFGKGIGYQKKKGDPIDESSITKIFFNKDNSYIISLVEELDPQILDVSETVINNFEYKFNKKLDSWLMVSLSDHITKVLSRYREGAFDLLNKDIYLEVPYLYTKEYEFSLEVVQYISSVFDVQLDKLEAAVIALHFVNAQNDTESLYDTLLITEITKNIIFIIQDLFDIVLNIHTVTYSRFLTHLRYLLHKKMYNSDHVQDNHESLYSILREQYTKKYACALVIRDVLSRDYNIYIDDYEMVYLIIHINRLISELS